LQLRLQPTKNRSFGCGFFILENSVNHSEHGEHSEKTTASIVLTYYRMGDARETRKPSIFAVSPWFELRF
jgi:hypothetical protein